MKKRLSKSTTDRKISGVCGGLAEYFEIDPTLVRAGYAILTLLTASFPGLLIYIILAFIMPDDDGYIDTDYNDKDN